MDSDIPQIDDTTAAELVRAALSVADEPLTSAEICEQTGLRAAVVRHHLRRLHDAGEADAVAVARVDGRRGRPARRWRLRVGPDPQLLATLATELAAVLDEHGDDDALAARLTQFGRQIAALVSPQANVDPLIDGLRRFGFLPHVVDDDAGRRCIELDACPFVDPNVGVTDPGICRAHALLAEGMVGSGRRLELLEVSASGIGCRLHVVADDDAAAAASRRAAISRLRESR